MTHRTQLKQTSIATSQKTYWNISEHKLIFQTIEKKQGNFSTTGALVCHTGEHTKCSTQDTYIVKDTFTKNAIWWDGPNSPYMPEDFDNLYKEVIEFISDKEIYITDVHTSAKKEHQLTFRVVSQYPWQNLFVKNLYFTAEKEAYNHEIPDWHIFITPDFKACPLKNKTTKENFTIINFSAKSILIGGSSYSGEIKKAISTVISYIMILKKNVLPLRCSANIGSKEDVALFFGASGTGKTTFTFDPTRAFIGDDLHGWDDETLFNIESGCYSKCLNINEEKEPKVFSAIRFGSLLENASFFRDTDIIDYSNKKITENVRACYPLHFLENSSKTLIGNMPKNIFLLTCDSFGVLPPISKLTIEQAMFYFISGYTARVREDDNNISSVPKAIFSPCFSESILPLHPIVYTELFGSKIQENNVNVWLVNTGWSGGPYGTGNRLKLSYTKAIINAAINNELEDAHYVKQPVTGLLMPLQCRGIPSHLLDPENAWNNRDYYFKTLNLVAANMIQNFCKYDSISCKRIKSGGPQVQIE
ncbi:phosphoenolpyruvate carboxykinase (ATP) [Flavobacterium rakeshii]|uniref:phosphoenolpyruvate carboxykinase (ATP) n=1 Tax=Flavobacterium rakeshii TaxID=1038845 RepID=UPI002E7B396A|nr:phosphoenolpyruvate carboxykinase (ATP) [Flavobacterium rakeshii]MEE1896959.1 phosphoenolpyruvate carboxykinase (ATP) [Flavobacterium rakeshii]